MGRDVALSEAYAWARTACMVAEEEGNLDPGSLEVFIYVVEPIGGVEPDGSADTGVEAMRCPRARIVDAVDHGDLWDHRPAHVPSRLHL